MDWSATPIIEAAWVCVDVETTGLEVEQGHRVCEVAAVRGGLGGPLAELDSLVNPQRTIAPDAAAVSGLSDADVASAPFFSEVASRVAEALAGAVVVAHNAPFDLGFLETELDLAACSLPPAPVIDTTVIAQTVFRLPVRNLPAVARILQLPNRPRHRAIDDARATRDLLLAGLEKLMAQGAETVGDVVEALLPAAPRDRPLTGDTFPELREALKRGGDVQLIYQSASGQTERVVRPIRLEWTRGHLLLSAYCRLRKAPRKFRLVSITRVGLA